MKEQETDVPAIELKDVDYSYGSAKALHRVSFSIEDGDMVSIIGPNGGGKSTLLRLILGLLQPDRGTVKIYGLPPGRVFRYLGYVPQYFNFDQQFPVTVMDVVLTGRLSKYFGFYSREDRKAAERALEEVRLGDIAKRPFSQLSGGQRQRVLIARALADSPSILLLDEPTAHVDAAVAALLYELLAELNTRHTVLLVSHDVGFVSGITTRVLCVNEHVHEHPVEEVDKELIAAAYGSPMRLVRHDINLEEGEENG
ncbi:MAG: metal ABC transporter ATP-binding protein [Sediminispirochaetaceae bacterium]